MTFLSTVLAFGTFPFWVWLLGRNYADFSKVRFPWWNMLLSLFTLVIPSLTGLLLRRYRPVLAFRISRYLNPIAVGKHYLLSHHPFPLSLSLFQVISSLFSLSEVNNRFFYSLPILCSSSSLYQYVYILYH